MKCPYLHTYNFRRPAMGSTLTVTCKSAYPEPACWVESFDGFEPVDATSEEVGDEA